MKTFSATLGLILWVTPVFADYTMPGSAPKVTCPKAVEVATSKLKDYKGAPDSYINRMTLLGAGDESVWIIWFASPSHGFTILAVEMDGRVRKATQDEIDAGRGTTKK